MKPDNQLVFVDTAAWFALVDQDDRNHVEAKNWYTDATAHLISTDYILDETLTLMQRKLGHNVAVQFGERFRTSDRIQCICIEKEDRERAWERFQTYRDDAMSFTDCTSFAVMDRLEVATAFTFDQDFTIAGYDITPG